MAMTGIEKKNYFYFSNEQNSILFANSIFELTFIKSNLLIFLGERRERLSSIVLPLELKFFPT
jgi:hypothetical protein